MGDGVQIVITGGAANAPITINCTNPVGSGTGYAFGTTDGSGNYNQYIRNSLFRAMSETGQKPGSSQVSKLIQLLRSRFTLLRATSFTSDTCISTRHGFLIDAGLLFQKGRIGIAPEFRYTRWQARILPADARDQNQVEFLVTIRF